MIKSREIADPKSCLNRAKMHEMIFVLLERDPATPGAIRAWIQERIRLGRNQPGDKKLVEAELCALGMEENWWA